MFQVMGYAQDPVAALTSLGRMLTPDGTQIMTRSHPLPFAVERAERDGTALGTTYHDTSMYSYRSGGLGRGRQEQSSNRWFAAQVNVLVDAGFTIERVEEPQLTPSRQAESPHKQDWMDKYPWIRAEGARLPPLLMAASLPSSRPVCGP